MGSVRRRSAPRGLALACALLLAAACQPGTAGDEPEEATEAPPAAETEAQDDPGDESDDAAEEEADETPRASGDGDLREPLALDIQQTHPNGTVVRILGARFLSNAIELEVEILNSAPRDVRLHATHQSGQMVVVDDADNRYPLNPPPDNDRVAVEGGQRLQGTLTFLGRVDPSATALTLHTYGGFDGEPGEQSPGVPEVSMSIDIPLGDG